MRTVKFLTSTYNDYKMGNHRVEMHLDYRKYYYFWTEICREYPKTKTFWIDDSYGTASTTRACNAYRKHFLAEGYTEVEK